MPAYAPHYTSRVRIKYQAGRFAHNMLFRFPGPSTGSGLTDAMSAIDAFLTALQPLMYDDFAVSAVSAANVDTNVFLPIANTLTPTGGVTPTTREPAEEATAWTFVARTTGGNPWKFSIFGLAQFSIEPAGGVNYRVNYVENGDIAAAIDVLNLNSTALIGNDGNPLHWAGYVDVKDNDHFVKELRG